MTIHPDTTPGKLLGPKALPASARWLPWLLGAAIVAVLFYQLGAAALFEPDEGRNAEKAREILVLNDWVTPHENFHAVLDKPMFFYWMIALAYSAFGVSEWAARLPSALAALGCVALVYRFSCLRWGRGAALWSALILLTSIEFFVLARVVIFDMTLTFFLTLALCSFYEAAHTESARRRRIGCVILYGALAAATLIKGLVGVAIPAMVIFFYVLRSRRWAVLRGMDPVLGIALLLAVVLPWYLAAEARNPGYLQYYLWEEHFGRFATSGFDRAEPWYYFIGVGLVGFLPWTLMLPLVVKRSWRDRFDDRTFYLILWVALPLLFFSLSKSKLPHYILPIFPPLAMLAASALVRTYQDAPARFKSALSLAWWVQTVTALYFVAGTFVPAILARQIRTGISDLAYFVWCYAALSIAMLVYLSQRNPSAPAPSQRQLFVLQGSTLCFFLAFVAHMMIAISTDRSARPIAETVRPRLTATSQVVFFDTYLAGLPFYLRSEQPLWSITHERKKRTFLGNYYAIGKRADPVTAWGAVILNFEEFRRRWNRAKEPLLIVVKEKNLPRLAEQVGAAPVRLGAADEYLLVSKRPEPTPGPDRLSQRGLDE